MRFLVLSLAAVAFMAQTALGFSPRLTFSSVGTDTKELTNTAESGLFCDLCVMIVADIECVLKNLETFGKSLLEDLCAYAPVEFQDDCVNVINFFLSLLIEVIDLLVDPQGICQIITLCGAEAKLLTAGNNIQPVTADIYRDIRSQVDEKYLCEACEDTLGFVHDAVASNQTWGEVAGFVMPLCELFPSQYNAKCQKFLESPGDVNEFANKFLNPVRDCQMLGFCFEQEPDILESEPTAAQGAQEPQIPPRAQGIDVEVDTKIYDITKKMMKTFGKSGENCMKMGLQKLDMMRKPGPILFDVGGETAANYQIPFNIDEIEGNRIEAVPDQKKCEVCRDLFSAADGVVQQNGKDITDGIAIVLEDICKALPQQYKDQCTSEVTEVVPGVIYKLALKVMKPDYLCNQLNGICK